MTEIHGNKRYPRLPAQQSIRVFEAAARHLNFTKAGDELALTQSGVSKQIKGLEAFLGSALFVREGHQLALTESGKILQQRASQALDLLQLAVDEIQGSQPLLRLQVPPTFAARWLIPKMGELKQSKPELDLHIETTWMRKITDSVNLKGDELALHACLNYTDEDASIVKLRQEWLCILASPAYLEKSGPINSAKDLIGQTLIHTRLDGHIHWQAWNELLGGQSLEEKELEGRELEKEALDVSQGYEFETLDMALSAAENGIGLVVCDVFYAIKALAEKRLVIPFNMPILLGLDYLLISKQPSKGAMAKYQDWLVQQVEEDETQLVQVLSELGIDANQKIEAFSK
ncbi:transcriptional regulator, LysR family protein [Marinomonas sp. MED121]|uniref:LysR substrate-binding domain-containing protein n=1 Tax=Marinomonas sp. MED121 TaxID=314277 RepID=UPI0000690542|nr:LysR substrate-binding domain-containing protein [Marinomonas sp. MED121]EAQ63332.1 transcriptional regulator, LysR family protein [Marinomonas sp. MED121]